MTKGNQAVSLELEFLLRHIAVEANDDQTPLKDRLDGGLVKQILGGCQVPAEENKKAEQDPHADQ